MLKRTPMKRTSCSLSRTPLKHTGGKIKNKPVPEEVKKQRQEDGKKMREFFTEIWNSRPLRSEVSTESLGYTMKSIFFHHILPKSRYKVSAYDPDNIILLTGDEHQVVEMDIYRYPEVNKRREQLKQKYNL